MKMILMIALVGFTGFSAYATENAADEKIQWTEQELTQVQQDLSDNLQKRMNAFQNVADQAAPEDREKLQAEVDGWASLSDYMRPRGKARVPASDKN